MDATRQFTNLEPTNKNRYWSTVTRGYGTKFDRWVDMLCDSHLPWAIQSTPNNDFDAHIEYRSFNDHRIVRCSCDAFSGFRSEKEISKTVTPYLTVLYIVSGCQIIDIEGTEFRVQSGDILLWDSSNRMSFNVPSNVEEFSLFMPEESLTKIFPNAHDFVGKVISDKSGVGTILSSHFKSLHRNMWHMDEGDLKMMMRPTMEMISTLFNRKATLSRRSMKEILLSRVKTYIVENLDDPGLTVASIAATHNVTTRYLHMLFEEVGITIGNWIRHHRLLRCKDDLINARITKRQIGDIAYCRGFSDLSHFSRSFKKEFGLSPRAFVNEVNVV